ncbi:MAG: isoprenylcysteine carboxylmethyltransferase family protein [Candidatus Omnitrophica bacterium]|nr:isoprenylcysteine carboxylmethyltransferase family protein [Candidatus Omnitrophota bacterium]
MPPAVLFVFLILCITSHFVLPIKKIIYPPYNYLGILLISLGIILNIWPDNMFKKKNIPIEPHDTPIQLETSGPFRISRNPMYLGMVLVLLGVASLLGSLSALFICPLFLAALDRIYISFEEQKLQNTFGQRYMDYKKEVRRWL